jgi:hypothetical protein
MSIGNGRAFRFLNACTILVAIGCAAPVVAAPPIRIAPPPETLDFLAGEVCAFPLQFELSGANFHFKEFVDRNGNPVRAIIAGKGSFMTFTNVDTDATLSVKAYGFAAHETYNLDGTTSAIVTGHVVQWLLPTDEPPGPSMTLYVGRLVFTYDPNTGANLSLQSFTGKSTDICATLQ